MIAVTRGGLERRAGAGYSGRWRSRRPAVVLWPYDQGALAGVSAPPVLYTTECVRRAPAWAREEHQYHRVEERV